MNCGRALARGFVGVTVDLTVEAVTWLLLSGATQEPRDGGDPIRGRLSGV
jgi:hypothetical protein